MAGHAVCRMKGAMSTAVLPENWLPSAVQYVLLASVAKTAKAYKHPTITRLAAMLAEGQQQRALPYGVGSPRKSRLGMLGCKLQISAFVGLDQPPGVRMQPHLQEPRMSYGSPLRSKDAVCQCLCNSLC